MADRAGGASGAGGAGGTGGSGRSAVDALTADLLLLGSSVGVRDDEVDAVVSGVTRRLPAPAGARTVPSRARWAAWSGGWRRRLAVALVVAVLALTGVPAVRAAVADWFGFGAAQVRLDPRAPLPSPAGGTTPPGVTQRVPVAAAAAAVAFPVVVPAALGEPEGVEVSDDRRVVSMSWTVPGVGVVRLDQFGGGLDHGFAKTAAGVRFTEVGGDVALWFDRPHAVRWLAGGSRTTPPRLSARTLIWQRGGVTLRLEGDLTGARAVEIAGSARTP